MYNALSMSYSLLRVYALFAKTQQSLCSRENGCSMPSASSSIRALFFESEVPKNEDTVIYLWQSFKEA